jgi:hypothetical protein
MAFFPLTQNKNSFWENKIKVCKFALRKNGAVVQVVRALDSYPPAGGRGFNKFEE